MKLSREGKKQRSSEFAQELKGASQLFFAEYQGLKFQELADLRAKLRPLELKCRVVKNSIARHAIEGAGIEGRWDDIFRGPVAMIAGPGTDPVSAARVLVGFAKEFEKFRLKAGFVEKKWFSKAEVETLSTLGSRQELLAKLAGALNQSVAQIASVLQAPMRDLALALKALEDKKAKQPA